MRMSMGVLALALMADAAGAQTFTVTNSGATAYSISTDGGPPQANPTLPLQRGTTYTFNVSATGHPFYIKTQRVTGTGSQYTDGVTGQGVASGTLTFVVPMNAPSTLFYQCGVHGAMGGTLSIIDPVGVPGQEPLIPRTAFLERPTPHPVRGPTRMAFGVPRAGMVELSILDVQGRTVRRLVRESRPAGRFAVDWNGRDEGGARVPGGIYFARLRAAGETARREMVVTP